MYLRVPNNVAPTEKTRANQTESGVAFSMLPDELVQHIIDASGVGFVFPALNKKFLPFHISTLYASVVLDSRTCSHFIKKLHTRPHLARLVIRVTYKVSPAVSADRPVFPCAFGSLLNNLVNLEEVIFKGDWYGATAIVPQPSWFAQNDKLRSISLRPSNVPSWLDDVPPIPEPLAGAPFQPDTSVETSGHFAEIARSASSASTFDARVRTSPMDSTYFTPFLSCVPITSLDFTSSTLDWIPPPLVFHCAAHFGLTSLSITSSARPHAPLVHTYYPTSPTVTHLYLGGTGVSLWHFRLGVREILESSALESIHVGPSSYFDGRDFVQIVRDLAAQSGTLRLKRLRLDNLFFATARGGPSESKSVRRGSEDSGTGTAEWTTECSREDVIELRDLCRVVGLETSGTTFEHLEI